MGASGFDVCIGCSVGQDAGFGAAEIIALVAAVAAIVGTYAGIQAFVVADRALRSGILREEFAGHRHRLEDSLTTLETALIGLRQSINPAMPFARLEGNFGAVFADVSRALGRLIDEAQRIERRDLFQVGWTETLTRPTRSVEREFDIVLEDTRPEGVRRASAAQVVHDLDQIISGTRGLIEDTVKAPLRDTLFGRFRKKGK